MDRGIECRSGSKSRARTRAHLFSSLQEGFREKTNSFAPGWVVEEQSVSPWKKIVNRNPPVTPTGSLFPSHDPPILQSTGRSNLRNPTLSLQTASLSKYNEHTLACLQRIDCARATTRIPDSGTRRTEDIVAIERFGTFAKHHRLVRQTLA